MSASATRPEIVHGRIPSAHRRGEDEPITRFRLAPRRIPSDRVRGSDRRRGRSRVAQSRRTRPVDGIGRRPQLERSEDLFFDDRREGAMADSLHYQTQEQKVRIAIRPLRARAEL